jgi:hypothetical protein
MPGGLVARQWTDGWRWRFPGLGRWPQSPMDPTLGGRARTHRYSSASGWIRRAPRVGTSHRPIHKGGGCLGVLLEHASDNRRVVHGHRLAVGTGNMPKKSLGIDHRTTEGFDPSRVRLMAQLPLEGDPMEPFADHLDLDDVHRRRRGDATSAALWTWTILLFSTFHEESRRRSPTLRWLLPEPTQGRCAS